jgi:hypothetical protein
MIHHNILVIIKPSEEVAEKAYTTKKYCEDIGAQVPEKVLEIIENFENPLEIEKENIEESPMSSINTICEESSDLPIVVIDVSTLKEDVDKIKIFTEINE